MDPSAPREEPYPAPTKQASGSVNGEPTEASCTNFSDKIMITISQGGRLSQWVNKHNPPPPPTPPLSYFIKPLLSLTLPGPPQIQVPLSAPSPALLDLSLPGAEGPASTLPSAHLTPKTLLGGGGEDRETLGQLYAAQIGSHLSLRDPEDRRTLVLGLGLGGPAGSYGREAFFDVLELVQKVL